MIITSSELPEVESIAGAPGVLPTPFAAMHGLPSPLAGPYNGVPPAGGLAGLGGFPLGAAGLGVRVQGSAQASAVLLVSNLNEEVSNPKLRNFLLLYRFPTRCSLDAKDERSHTKTFSEACTKKRWTEPFRTLYLLAIISSRILSGLT